MKKQIFALAFALVAISGHARTYHYDVNKDGVVSITDVTFLVNNILGITNSGEDEQNFIYDVNGDGMVNVTDVTCLINKILGLLNPIEEPPAYLTCPDENHPHFIDLGLPSGTKWACCNVGAGKPEAFGGYYSWGETEERTVYSWSTYTLCEGSGDTCKDLGDDIAYTEYDVAHVKWGAYWRVPSKDQILELLANCTNQRTTVNDVEGRTFTGPSGGTIFLPAAGYRWDDECYSDGFTGYYWSSTQDPSYLGFAFSLFLRCDDKLNNDAWQINDYRYSGISVRPVSSCLLLLATNSVTIVKGRQENVAIVSGTGNYTVESSDPGVATAVIEDNSVKVTTTSVGKATITVKDTKTGITSNIQVTVAYLELSCNKLTILSGSQKSVDIISGTGNYDVTSSDETVATVVVKGNLLKVNAVGDGNSIITVTDNAIGMTETIEVTVVSPLAIATSSLALTVRSQETVEVTSGSGRYDVASSVETVATAVMEDNLVKVTAKGKGECTITVTDMVSGLTETIEVAVAPNILSSNSFWLYIGSQRSVDIVSGSGSYSVQSSDEEVATAVIENNVVKVTGVSEGKATIKVTDTNTGFASTIDVTVISRLKLSTTTLYLGMDSFDTVEIISGSGSYNVSSSSSEKVIAELEGNIIKVTANTNNRVVNTDILLTDKISGQTVKIEVFVVRDRIALSANDLTISRGLYKTVEITEGSGNYSVVSRDETVATAVMEDNLVKVTAMGEGQTTIRVADTETHVSSTIYVTVVDSLLLSNNKLVIEQGSQKMVEIISGNGGMFTTTCSKEALATAEIVDDQVVVTAKSDGIAYITVTDTNTGLTATLKVSVIPKTYLSCPDSNHPHLIDLGLPSGTMWACCNVDTKNSWRQSPTHHGGFYAWGETEVKNNYSWDNYVCDLDDSYDGNDIAGTKYDVAHVKWGGLWVMPSEDQINEFVSYCFCTGLVSDEWEYVFPNGGTIILPRAGRMMGDYLDRGACFYWTSTAVPNSWVSKYLFGGTIYQENRCYGYQIRPVVCPEK